MSDPAAGWSALHHGIDPRTNRLLFGWLRLMWWAARPLCWLRVPPTAITVTGAALAIGAALGRWPWIALALILASVLCDGLDGAVAVLRDRATSEGAVADKAADRIADVAFVVVLWRSGAPALLAVIAGVAMLAVELLREVEGGARRAAITVAERPSRVICVVLACVCAGLSSESWPATVCAAVLLALSVVGTVQLRLVGRASAASRAGADGESAA